MGKNKISNNKTVIFPYRAQRYLSLIFFIFSIAFLLFILIDWPVEFPKILFAIYFCLSVLFSIIMGIQSRLYVTVDVDGMLLQNQGSSHSFYATWSSFYAVYSIYGSKGKHYFLFSTKPCTDEEIRRIARECLSIKGGNLNAFIDGNVFYKVDNCCETIISTIDGRLPIIDLEGQNFGL